MKPLAFTSALLASAALFAGGCASTCPDCDGSSCEACSPSTGDAPKAEETSAAFNKNCPTSGRPVVASVGTVSYMGKEVGFCCGGCKAGWGQVAEADKDAFIASEG